MRRWSQQILSKPAYATSESPQEVVAAQWLGYPGATEDQIAQAETRLGTRLPSSYRDFLKASNGWRATTPFIDRLWSTEDIEWFSVRHQDWIDRHVNHYRRLARINWNGYLKRPLVTDEAYFVYGDNQDCRNFRVEYLQTALEISAVSDSAIYLLNPAIVDADGEWEAWFFADWLPGADRYPSFQALMEAEYRNSLELWDLPPDSNHSFFDCSSSKLNQPDTISEAYSTGMTTFIIEVQGLRSGNVQKFRTIIHDELGELRETWPYLALKEASQWMTQQVLGLRQQRREEFVISFQTRDLHGQIETRTLIYDSVGKMQYLEFGLETGKVCRWIIERFSQ